MTDTYLQNQNISNNIIINKSNDHSKFKKSFKKRYSPESLNSSDEEKYETIDNQVNDSTTSLDIEEVPKLEEEIDHIQNFNKEQKQILQLNDKTYGEISRNNKSKQSSNDINSLTTKSPHLSRAVSWKILPLQMKTNMILGNNKNFFENSMECKRTTSNSKITAKQTESRFNSASENKCHFFHRKTVSNGLSGQQNIAKKNEFFLHKNKIPNNFAKVTKISSETQHKSKIINKIATVKKHDKFKSDIDFQILNNNFNGNFNKNVKLSPSNNTHQATVTRTTNVNINGVKNIHVDILFNSNNNLKEGNMRKNIKIIKNNFTNINNINNFGRFSPKNNVKTKIRKLNNKSLNNYTFNNLSNSNQDDIDGPKDKLSPKKSNKIINERFSQIKGNYIEKNLINKEINCIQRLTVPYKQSPDKKNDLEQNKIKDGIIKNNQQIEINPRIDFNRTLNKVHAKSKSPRCSIVKKLPPLNNTLKDNIDINQKNINNLLINQINRRSASPFFNGSEKQLIENIMNEKNRIQIVKNNNNKNEVNNNIPNNEIKKNSNDIKEINNIKTVYTINNISNNIKSINTMNNLNPIINIQMNIFKNNQINCNDNTQFNNNKFINNNFSSINKINNNMNLNNINNLKNIGILSQNNTSRNQNFQKNLQNSNTFNKTASQTQNFIPNALMKNSEPKVNIIHNQQRNTLVYNNFPQNFKSNDTLNINQNQQINNFIPQIISNINNNLNVESHRLTQIPTNFYNNNLYIQNDILNHLPNQYLNNQNIYNLSDNQIYNNIQNQNINLISQENYVKNQEKSKEFINSKDVDITFNKFDASGWVKNYGILTLPGKDLSGCQKTNQDSFVFKTNVNNIKDFNIFGVLDGHGPEGHFVSKFVSE